MKIFVCIAALCSLIAMAEAWGQESTFSATPTGPAAAAAKPSYGELRVNARTGATEIFDGSQWQENL